MPKPLGRTKAPTRSRDNFDLNKYVDIYKFPDRKWVMARLVGPVASTSMHWIEIRKKDGSKTKIPKYCLNWNQNTEEFEDHGCPYCAAELYADVTYWINAIIREIQEDEPRKKYPPVESEKKPVNIGDDEYPFKARLKDADSRTWTPARILRIPASLMRQVTDIPNTRHIKKSGKVITKSFELTDPKYGRDINFKFDNSQSGTGKYVAQAGDQVELSPEEQKYLLFPIDFQEKGVETLERALKEWDSIRERLVQTQKEDEKKKRKRSSKLDLEEELIEDTDDDLDDDDAFDEIEKKVSRKNKQRRSSKSRTKRPPRGSKPKSKSRKTVDDWDDDDIPF